MSRRQNYSDIDDIDPINEPSSGTGGGGTGPRGLQGPPGTDGIDGTDGMDGTDGTDGMDGSNGIKGDTGSVGPKGDPGEQGRDGRDGNDGNVGRNGRDGIDGVNGEKGEKGDTGPAGKNGTGTGTVSNVDYNDLIREETRITPLTSSDDPGIINLPSGSVITTIVKRETFDSTIVDNLSKYSFSIVARITNFSSSGFPPSFSLTVTISNDDNKSQVINRSLQPGEFTNFSIDITVQHFTVIEIKSVATNNGGSATYRPNASMVIDCTGLFYDEIIFPLNDLNTKTDDFETAINAASSIANQNTATIDDNITLIEENLTSIEGINGKVETFTTTLEGIRTELDDLESTTKTPAQIAFDNSLAIVPKLQDNLLVTSFNNGFLDDANAQSVFLSSSIVEKSIIALCNLNPTSSTLNHIIIDEVPIISSSDNKLYYNSFTNVNQAASVLIYPSGPSGQNRLAEDIISLNGDTTFSYTQTLPTFLETTTLSYTFNINGNRRDTGTIVLSPTTTTRRSNHANITAQGTIITIVQTSATNINVEIERVSMHDSLAINGGNVAIRTSYTRYHPTTEPSLTRNVLTAALNMIAVTIYNNLRIVVHTPTAIVFTNLFATRKIPSFEDVSFVGFTNTSIQIPQYTSLFSKRLLPYLGLFELDTSIVNYSHVPDLNVDKLDTARLCVAHNQIEFQDGEDLKILTVSSSSDIVKFISPPSIYQLESKLSFFNNASTTSLGFINSRITVIRHFNNADNRSVRFITLDADETTTVFGPVTETYLKIGAFDTRTELIPRYNLNFTIPLSSSGSPAGTKVLQIVILRYVVAQNRWYIYKDGALINNQYIRLNAGFTINWIT